METKMSKHMGIEMDKRKKLPAVAYIVMIIYASVFVTAMMYAVFVPSRVYDNPELLAKNQNSANKINYKLNRHDGVTTVTCQKMQGMDIVWEYQADEDAVRQMYYNFDVTSGKAKLILIQPDKTVITLTEHDSTADENSLLPDFDIADDTGKTTSVSESVTKLDLKKGTNRIKIVCGKGTAFSLSFRIPE